ncbi:outer membrane lipoprotein Slp [Candidatus Nitrosoglobus terrae]|uniref:Outer membrane lipoprotein Slp n=1 Tax=Candidatus Nitrosoglobus terrae TaxID=1630141 RepID=A0A1Q2SMH3_9GAMM|nr:Slp family lipoprotein [Candidatus Nitrosoglobus terrae]BAW80330.1 outer membrane lipoprotein Slp [Candidatus Nitrosoglobus terrae]
MLWKISFIIAIFILEGCASQVPSTIRESLPKNPSLGAVQNNISHYQGTRVRWGGAIAGIQNKEKSTIIEVVALNLGDEGRPKEEDSSPGRFWAEVDGFLDSTIYRNNRKITIYGTVKGVEGGHIGEHAYLFPVIQVDTYYLWETVKAARPYYYPPYGFGYGLYSPYYYGGFYPFWNW